MVYIRKITRSWKTKEGKSKSRSYYYWYKSRRIGDKVISECVGRASEEEYIRTHKDKIEAEKAKEKEELSEKRPTIKQVK
jgi:hypothetical protein